MEVKSKYKKELLESIPVVAGMNIEIAVVEPRQVTLVAPLDTNINYEGTAFGGSINTLGILSCYLLTHHILKDHAIEFSSLVIQNGNTEYLRPIDGEFCAEAKVDEQSLNVFLKTLQRRGKARLAIASEISCVRDSAIRAQFNGRFVVSI